MNIHLTRKLRASVVAVSAASLTLIAPAFAEESRWQQHQNQQSSKNIPQFSELDQNNDQRLTQDELKEFAQRQNKEAEQYLDQYDENDNQALDQNEFQQLTKAEKSASADGRMAAVKGKKSGEQSAQEQQPDGANIVVDQKPTQVAVDKPAPQITIEQPKPKVTITTQDPKVEVEQAEPRVSVQQAKPQVSVDQAKPDVEVQEADPNVQVRASEPQVEVREQEPEVDIQTAQQQRTSAEQQRLTSEARRQQVQADDARQQASTQQAVQSQEGIYAQPISELRDAEVVDNQGQTIGSVEEVVIRRDASEAGFIISTTGATGDEARHVYRSAEDFSVEDGQLKLNAEDGAEALNKPQGFVSQDFRAASENEGTLGELLRREGLSAR